MDIAVIMLSLLLVLSSTRGGVAKLAGASIARADAKRLGFTYSTYRIVGALELAAAGGCSSAWSSGRWARPRPRAWSP